MAGLNFSARPFVPPGGGDDDDAARQTRGGFGSSSQDAGTRGTRGAGNPPVSSPSSNASAVLAQRDDLPDHLLDAIVGRECTLEESCAFPHATAGTFYTCLGVSRSASADEIAEAFARWKGDGLPRAIDHDAGKAAAVDRLVCEAAQVLLTP
eukprot:CAMPEP_0174850956 /NCGR_PEP_ID=MMETSP1114-20130205/21230_1 /TAXON_ID=312471 /ORGANISM="Neobodo designis, Strain CCAP 1951/1" /LENGTH=151 /DNA_ID=CAMNT_0016085451 /DNA_START=26 /DNA_END=478 /DNA_ORIENTATION=-